MRGSTRLSYVRTTAGIFGIVAALTLLVGCGSTDKGAAPVATAPTTTTAPARPLAKPLTCPARAPDRVAAGQIGGTTDTLVPGAPTAVLACRYHGLNQPQPAGSLAKSISLAPGPIANALNAGTVVPKGAAYSCPNATGETILLVFGYGDVARLEVSVPTSGCTFADNGDRVVQTPASTLAQLDSALGHDSTP